MKLLLDECVPARLRHHIPGHDVSTVPREGWAGIKNGPLLSLAAAAGFEALVTIDAGMQHQQNPATLPLAVIILHAPSNSINDLLPLAPNLVNALQSLVPKAFTQVRK